MNKKRIIVIVLIIIIGIIVPFISYFTIIQLFFLLIPFAIVFVISLIYLIVCLFDKNLNTQKALFVFSMLPIFIISQILSGFTVDKIQRLRSDRIISEIEKLKSETGNLPEKYDLIAGIEYVKMKD